MEILGNCLQEMQISFQFLPHYVSNIAEYFEVKKTWGRSDGFANIP